MKVTIALLAVLPAALAIPGHARFEIRRRQATGSAAAVVDTAAPAADTAAPVVENDAPAADTLAAVVNTPAPAADTSAAVADTAAPVVETSAAVADTAAPVVETSVAAADTAAPAADAATTFITVVDDSVSLSFTPTVVIDPSPTDLTDVTYTVSQTGVVSVTETQTETYVTDSASPTSTADSTETDTSVANTETGTYVTDSASPTGTADSTETDTSVANTETGTYVTDSASPTGTADSTETDTSVANTETGTYVTDSASPTGTADSTETDTSVANTETGTYVTDSASPTDVATNSPTYTADTKTGSNPDTKTDATYNPDAPDATAYLPTDHIPSPPTLAGSGPIPTVNPNAVCVPPQYQCRYDAGSNLWGWEVCTTGFKWANGGSCKTGEVCVYNALSRSPYCVPSGSQVPPTGGSGNNDKCPAGKYRCAHDSLGHSGWSIQSCGSDGNWQHFDDCEAGKFCTYSPVAGYPYCKAPDGGSGGSTSVCFPGTYQCAYDYGKKSWGWQVCNVAGSWVWGGNCPTGKTCSFNNLNGSPYCV